ncbi:hypothetical protein P691DRAFT_768624 [Macrolepiota fuliginosa MF-IS2]|uniref:Uncharacterized protein n=1 Tax=Macrolepiota fuliginosa MF-IS2 TaxID=1400762 RepID=A0A9P5WY51_9AGAR|nr:hypothetical protein P691DRAFT_768624 [Macrolepiota fuliginosa MF-IS2]
MAATVWFFCQRKICPEMEDWTTAGNSLEEISSPLDPLSSWEVQPTHFQHPYRSIPNASWTSSAPQMPIINMPMGTNIQPNEHQANNQSKQDFDPYTTLVLTLVTIQHPSAQHSLQSSGHYAPTVLSTTTDQPTPGILGSNKTPLLTSLAPFPSASPSYYAPEKPTAEAAHLSYMSDMPASASVAAAYQHQDLSLDGSASQVQSPESSNSIDDAEPKPRKLEKGKKSWVVMNRSEDGPEGSSPPAYTPN